MGIFLNRLLGTTQAKISKRQQLSTPQKGNYKAGKLQFLKNYLKAGEPVVYPSPFKHILIMQTTYYPSWDRIVTFMLENLPIIGGNITPHIKFGMTRILTHRIKR